MLAKANPLTWWFHAHKHAQVLEISKAKMLVRLTNGIVDPTFERPGFLRQLSTLLWRDSVVAVRDPTLYYLQVSQWALVYVI